MRYSGDVIESLDVFHLEYEARGYSSTARDMGKIMKMPRYCGSLKKLLVYIFKKKKKLLVY